MYRQAMAIVYRHSLYFGSPLLWGGTFTTSKYGLGLSLLYVPGLILCSWLQSSVPGSGGVPYNWALFYQDPLYTVACAPVHVLIVAASAYLVARFIRDLGGDSHAALWGLTFYGAASPAIVYARGDWAQPLTGLCWIAALYAAYRFRRTGRNVDLLFSGLALFYALLTRPVEGTLLLPAIGAVLTRGFSPRDLLHVSRRTIVVLVLSYLGGVAVTLLVNWGRYGSPFVTGYEGEGWTTAPWVGLAGAVLSPGRGILWEFPATVLLPLGLHRLLCLGQRKIAIVLVGLSVLQLLNVATWDVWWGGWNWGLRLFVPALPLVAVLAAFGVDELKRPLHALVPMLLLAAGVLWAVPCIVIDLLNNYGGTYSSTAASFSWSAYPPIGAWSVLHHWRAIGPIDSNSADILWLHLARATNNISLIPPAVLLLAFATLAVRALAGPGWRYRGLSGLPLRQAPEP